MNDRPTARLTEDDRYELAARAEAGSRANRPTHLVTLGLVVLCVSLCAAVLGWSADARAAGDLGKRSRELALIKDRAGRLADLNAQAATAGAEDLNRPIPDMLSRLQSLAREAGLTVLPEVPRTETESFTDARRVNYRYSVRDRSQLRDPSLEKMLAWVSLVVERIPGMHVRQIALTPAANAWTMEITFARFERLE